MKNIKYGKNFLKDLIEKIKFPDPAKPEEWEPDLCEEMVYSIITLFLVQQSMKKKFTCDHALGFFTYWFSDAILNNVASRFKNSVMNGMEEMMLNKDEKEKEETKNGDLH